MNTKPMTSQPVTKPIKLFLASLLIGSAALTHSFAQSITVNLSAGIGERDVRLAGGSPVPVGNHVRVGFFTPGFDVIGNAGNVASLASAWNPLGWTTIKNIFGEDGRFGAMLTSPDASFSGQKICLWIFQTTDNSAPSANFENLLGYGLFSSSTSDWVFPQAHLAPPGNATSINSSEVNQAYFGSFDASHLFLTQVPEPSTWSLFLAGFLGWKAWKALGRRSRS